MRKIILMILVLIAFTSCCKYRVEEYWSYHSPNWTSDNKIVFLEQYEYHKFCESLISKGELVERRKEWYLWEVDINEDYRRIARLPDNTSGYYGLSSAQEWVVFPVMNNGMVELWLIKRDGTGLYKLTNGKYPDFSPDAEKVVFVRDDGLYVINRDGSGIKKIVNDSNATHPAWSSDKEKIALKKGTLIVVDTLGNLLKDFGGGTDYPDWGPGDSLIVNMIKGQHWGIIIDYLTSIQDTFKVFSGAGFCWSPNGKYFIGHDQNGYFVIKRNGTDKWYIKP